MRKQIILLIVLLASLAMMSHRLWLGLEESNAYDNAKPCEPGRVDDCIAVSQGEVVDATHEHSSRGGGTYTVVMRLADPPRMRHVSVDAKLYAALPVGTKVRVQTLGNSVVMLERDGVMTTLPGKLRRGQAPLVILVVALAAVSGFLGWRIVRLRRARLG